MACCGVRGDVDVPQHAGRGLHGEIGLPGVAMQHGCECHQRHVVVGKARVGQFDGELVDTMAAALKAEDRGARPVPYMLSGGTDAKHFEEKLGMRCFGFAPLRLPPDLDFASLFHGVDERVPVESLRFGARVLDRFLRSC